MIDTDKYEGHADGDWYWNDTGILMDMFGTPIAEMAEGWNTKEATAQLIADAPLLLEEVKELREGLRITQRNLSIVRNVLALGYPDIEEAIWKLIGEEE